MREQEIELGANSGAEETDAAKLSAPGSEALACGSAMSTRSGPVKLEPMTLAQVERAAEFLLAGELVGLPTETVYGLAARGDDAGAIERIFLAKGRPRTNPLILHVADVNDVPQFFTKELDSVVQRRLDCLSTLWPGPMTLIGPKRETVLDAVTAGGATVAIRVPDHPLARAVLRRMKELAGEVIPVAAPSANVSNYVSPTTAEHVRQGLGDRIAMVLDGGACRVGVESTIVHLGSSEDPPSVLRSGFFGVETIVQRIDSAELAGQVVVQSATSAAQSEDQPAAAPGQFAKHYSPQTQLVLLPPGDRSPIPDDTLRIVFEPVEGSRSGSSNPRLLNRSLPNAGLADTRLSNADRVNTDLAGENLWTFAEDGTLETAASNLYAVLRKADATRFHRIEVVACEESGIGVAILDRLRRAAHA
ncbi:L-threonylcarbamoyladenylate synthase [Neorhodopirellula lusitana]|uniref:Threonylcarbamoyl-AMP synthase n=1 Tax=Neorhodopirellula lusitana TaxID=445327 RepID=A0ABY1QKL1_9BACT|nr:L-threonylcarbamoyladenylate synthase [Neorhodopirellula lusitana]SMP72207.1 L-threonylcarbamoyladenylate synthase [Neorhodopirellula lusitana]